MTDSTNQPDQPDELRAEYQALAERNWNAIQEIHGAYRGFSRTAKRLLVLLFVIQILTGIGIYVALGNSGNASDKATRVANSNAALVREIEGLVLRVAHNQRADTRALCALRGDLQHRVTDSEDFLSKHPNGIPGIPAATIQQSIDNENRTITALAPVPCPRTARAKHPKRPQHPKH